MALEVLALDRKTLKLCDRKSVVGLGESQHLSRRQSDTWLPGGRKGWGSQERKPRVVAESRLAAQQWVFSQATGSPSFLSPACGYKAGNRVLGWKINV